MAPPSYDPQRSSSGAEMWRLLLAFLAGCGVTALYLQSVGSPIRESTALVPVGQSGLLQQGKAQEVQEVQCQCAPCIRTACVCSCAPCECDPCAHGYSRLLRLAGARGADSSAPRTCLPLAYSTDGRGSEWHHLKWMPPVSQCLVAGLPIDEPAPHFNFRPGFALGFSRSREDRTHLLPYLRAAHDRTLSLRERRVLLNLGARYFGNSTGWFLRMYPMAFTEIHAFESSPGVFRVPPFAPDRCLDLDMNKFGRVEAQCSAIPNHVVRNIRVHEEFVDTHDDPKSKPPRVNITRIVKDVLKLTPADTVVVKMDIDGTEWKILPVWMEDPDMPLIIDELFVEIHYEDKSFAVYPTAKGHSRSKATKLLEDLRAMGFYAHFWP